MKKGIILIAIGFLLLAIDIPILVGNPYPPMETVEDLGQVIQETIINNLIGRSPRIDIISDLLGFIFLFIGAFILLRYNKGLILGMILIPCAIYLYFAIMQQPYYIIVHRDLYLKSLAYHFLFVFIEITIELIIIKAVIAMVELNQTKWNINELLIGWILAMISKGVLAGIQFFYGRGLLYIIYSVILIGATIFYLNRLYVITKYKLEGIDDKK